MLLIYYLLKDWVAPGRSRLGELARPLTSRAVFNWRDDRIEELEAIVHAQRRRSPGWSGGFRNWKPKYEHPLRFWPAKPEDILTFVPGSI